MKYFFLALCIVQTIWASPIQKKIVEGLSQKPGRIIGGTEAVASQFPFMAAVRISKAGAEYFCGGTLLNNQWVLTAGQCAENAISFRVSLGSHFLTRADPNRQIFTTGTFELHENYDPMTHDNDIALIKFHLPITFTDYIRPIDKFPDVDVPEENTIAVQASGWGDTTDTSSAMTETLQYVDLVTLPSPECNRVYANYVTTNMVCVAGNNIEGTCFGDTGGPIVRYERPGHIVQYGVSIFHSPNGCEFGDPSGFTRTFPYKTWIADKLAA